MRDEKDIRKRLQRRLRGVGQDRATPTSTTPPTDPRREAIFRGKFPGRARPAEGSVPPDRASSDAETEGGSCEPQDSASGASARALGCEPVALEADPAGREVYTEAGAPAWLVEQSLAELPGGWSAMCQAFRRLAREPGSPLAKRLRRLCGAAVPTCEDMLFLDLETTGLGGNVPVFLIGTMVWDGEGFVVRQYFARDYSEERAILHLYARAAAGRRLVISFNGKSFDVPFLRVRAAATGADFVCPPAHLDLLHVSRRIWGGQFVDCKLQTLEKHVCGRGRLDDIPGHLIPDAYHEFVRTADAREMVQCLKHNRLDLMTLADLMTRLPKE